MHHTVLAVAGGRLGGGIPLTVSFQFQQPHLARPRPAQQSLSIFVTNEFTSTVHVQYSHSENIVFFEHFFLTKCSCYVKYFDIW